MDVMAQPVSTQPVLQIFSRYRSIVPLVYGDWKCEGTQNSWSHHISFIPRRALHFVGSPPVLCMHIIHLFASCSQDRRSHCLHLLMHPMLEIRGHQFPITQHRELTQSSSGSLRFGLEYVPLRSGLWVIILNLVRLMCCHWTRSNSALDENFR
jgi:hypothetical protein